MKYICSWSGGKDSTASIILAHLHNEPLDLILFSEVFFNETVSGELPEHIAFVYKSIKLFESWGYEVKVLRSHQTYMDVFNHVVTSPRKVAKNKGKRAGFPNASRCPVRRDLKLKPIYEFYNGLNEEYFQYIGIAADEKDRLESLRSVKNAISLLEKYNYSEEMCVSLCKEYNLYSPAYQYSKRQGCWFCPNAKIEECRCVKEKHPDAWKSFVALEDEPNLINYKWSLYGATLKERDNYLTNFKPLSLFDF